MTTYFAKIEIDPASAPDVEQWSPDILGDMIVRALEPLVDADIDVIGDAPGLGAYFGEVAEPEGLSDLAIAALGGA